MNPLDALGEHIEELVTDLNGIPVAGTDKFMAITPYTVWMLILFIVAIYLQWMPVNLGVGIIVEWIIIACVFAAVFWCGFYIYYYLVARDLNNKLSAKK